LWVIQNRIFSREGVVSTSSNPQSGVPHLVGCPQLLIQFIHSYPSYRRPFLHPQPDDAPCRGYRDPLDRTVRVIPTFASDVTEWSWPRFKPNTLIYRHSVSLYPMWIARVFRRVN
jgi:hypothetical protein